jgi:aryl-alcohol dehydrogenase-like predicted oxidoreductase
MEWNRIGFGTWPLSGDKNGSVSYGKVDEDQSRDALATSFTKGVNVYDTSNFYGFGYVERLIGDVFHNLRSSIAIITKGGFLNKDEQDFHPDYLFESLMNSLKRLNTGYVDVYMLHSPPFETLYDRKVISFLKYIKTYGYAREVGVSALNPSHGFTAIFNFDFDVIEINYNILDHRAETIGLFNLCQNRKVKTVIRTPLAQGILSGKFVFNGDSADVRQQWKQEKVNKETEIYKKMLSVLDENTYTDAQNCLRFCLSNPNVSVIIPGMKTKEEVIENTDSLRFPLLTNRELEEIKKIYKLHYDS